MEQYRETGKVDPDYESYNSALELNEEEDKKENLNKIRKIIDEEYSKDILQRQEQIEKIELQICKVRKILHLLRYALIMSYYKKKELEYNGSEEEASTSDSFIIPDSQNRIHPAVKKLLGKNINNLEHLNIKDKRKSLVRATNQRFVEPVDLPQTKKIKLDPEKLGTHQKVGKNQETSFESIRNRKKNKYRVVVGNISKWMPSSEDDILTHKWMVYVRGPKEKPDVSHFIDKVVFYLHPSYKPHDIVQVSESPFHLSRRGWGEFPVRVQIFFKVTLNKPIDVVHNIKLDKTYSGRQTLGNETLIDVFLYDNVRSLNELEVPNPIPENAMEDINIEECDLSVTELASSSIEHDYCSGGKKNLKKAENEISFDHSYSLPSFHEGLPKAKKEKIEQDEGNTLIYGLESYVQSNENPMQPNQNVITPNNLLQLNRKDIKFNNTKIIVFGKNIEGCLLTNFNKLIQTSKISPKNELNRIAMPKNRFKNMGEALPYLFKRLPLFTDLANNSNCKRIYPFTASSLKEFVSWNVGKRRSSEWSRARTIKKMLLSEKIHGVDNWNTKAILMYGRSHDFTPFISYGLFNRDSKEKNLILSCYSDSAQNKKNTFNNFVQDPEITVNVDSDTEMTSPTKNKNFIDITDPHVKLECSYVRQTALDCGIILKPEEISEGVRVNGAEIMILEAVKCFAENLIRRAKNHRVCTKIFSPSTSVINKEDVEVAINERPDLFLLRQFQHERRNVEYFS